MPDLPKRVRLRLIGGGETEATAAPTPVVGLLVGYNSLRPGYMIIHEPTRSVVGSRFPSAEAALACAVEIGPMLISGVIAESATRVSIGIPRAECERVDAIVKRWHGDGVSIVPKRRPSR